jgi:hypothetical protein
MTLRSLTELKPDPDPEVVALLEEMLAAAQSGELTGIVMVTTYGNRHGQWSAPDALWAIEIWKQRVVDLAMDMSEEEE